MFLPELVLNRYIVHYVLTHSQIQGPYACVLGVVFASLLVVFIGLGKLILLLHHKQPPSVG